MTASDQAIDEAAQIYAAILDDPVRAAEIRRDLAALEAAEHAKEREEGDPN